MEISDLRDILKQSSTALDFFEQELRNLENLAQLSVVRVDLNTILDELEQKLENVAVLSALQQDLTENVAKFNIRVEENAGQLGLTLDDILPKFDGIIESAEESAGNIGQSLDTSAAETEETIQLLENDLSEMVDNFTSQIDDALAETTSAVHKVTETIVSTVEGGASAVVGFVHGADQTLGKIADILEQVDKSLGPVKPALSAMEALM